MSGTGLRGDARSSRDLDARMSDDERAVRERLDLVRDMLQAKRARRGALERDHEADLRKAIASFVERARTDGWLRAFDLLLEEARHVDSGDASHKAEFAKVVEYLAEIEPLVVRLARSRRETPGHEDKAVAKPSVLRASKDGVPALHRIPGFVAEDAATKGAQGVVEPGALGHLRALSRDVFDEIASLALLRVPALDEPWTLGAAFEGRLLEMLDAAIALGRGPISLDIVRAGRTYAASALGAEPYQWFVPTFLLACTEGERAVDALREVLLDTPESMLEGVVDAVCLGSNPAALTMAQSLLDEDDRPEVLCAALDILVRLGGRLEGRFLALVEHPEPSVAKRAVTAASLVLDGQQGLRLLSPLLDDEERSGCVASVLTMLSPELGAPHLRAIVRRGMKDGASAVEIGRAVDAAEVLAALGQTRDGDLLFSLAGVSDEAYRALATFGSPEALDVLRAELTKRDRSSRKSKPLASAIARITGLVEQDEPTPDGRAAARQQWLGEVIAFVAPKGASRVRLGKAFEPSLLVEEMVHAGTRVQTRHFLAKEMRIVGGGPIPIDLRGWVAPQRAWLDLAKQAGWSALSAQTRRS